MAKKKVRNRLQQIGEAGSRNARPSPPKPGRPSDTQLVELGMFVSATVLGTLILAVLALIFGMKAIESRLETEAMATIDRAVAQAAEEDPTVVERTEVSVDATATDIRLRGTVGVETFKDDLPAAILAIEGVTSVTTDLEYVPPVDRSGPTVVAGPISVIWAAGDATIVGEVSSEPNRSLLVSTLDEIFPDHVTSDEFVVKEGAPSERDWISSAVGIIDVSGTTLAEGKVFINPAERIIQVTGQYETRQQRADAEQQVQAFVDGTTFNFINGLSIPEPPPFTHQQVEQLQQNIDDLIAGKVVEFELNSDRLTPAGVDLLNEILDALEQFPNVPIEIDGYTDNQGDEAANQDLSERRAQAAFDYFTAKGQDPTRFVVQGFGEQFPVASNDTEEGRARNRRIEFKALEE
ncbi:MAG: OmpA family protein [Acidimicrobiia bacterium]